MESGQASRIYAYICVGVCVCMRETKSTIFSAQLSHTFHALLLRCFEARSVCLTWRHFSGTVDKSLDRTSGLSCKISTWGKWTQTEKRASDISLLSFVC